MARCILSHQAYYSLFCKTREGAEGPFNFLHFKHTHQSPLLSYLSPLFLAQFLLATSAFLLSSPDPGTLCGPGPFVPPSPFEESCPNTVFPCRFSTPIFKGICRPLPPAFSTPGNVLGCPESPTAFQRFKTRRLWETCPGGVKARAINLLLLLGTWDSQDTGQFTGLGTALTEAPLPNTAKATVLGPGRRTRQGVCFLITLLCDRSRRVKGKYEKLLLFRPGLLIDSLYVLGTDNFLMRLFIIKLSLL